MDGVTHVPVPHNEPVRTYAPGSDERATLAQAVNRLSAERHELTHFIGDQERGGDGDAIEVVQPHKHSHVLGEMHNATDAEVAAAIAAAKAAAPGWRDLPYDERAAVLLRAADLLAGPWRDTVNAATMLGQSKSVQQAEVDAACELADFLRYNAHFGRQVLDNQPESSPGVWNRFDHRPLEGFVLAITPFNFTAIAGNLPTSPALMGNTVVWKPSPTQALSAHYFMKLLRAAGLPPGVINLVHGDGAAVSRVALADPDLAGIHFTGSTRTFQHLWRTVGENLTSYRTYPRLVGETGGKDFIIAHPSANRAALGTAIVRGAFEYQGQKCSAASRVYVPRSLWNSGLRDEVAATADQLTYGDVTDFSNFGGAVIDRRSFDKLAGVLDRVKNDSACTTIAGGSADDSVGYFVRPTVVECTDPTNDVFVTEYFGPVVAVSVFDDSSFDDVVAQAGSVSSYALTGAIFADDRQVIDRASTALRFSAGIFYINDKPTGAVVGQQPFGGARASGTNDKAGSIGNLLRWVSPRSIKETFVPPTNHRYPHMG
ncbi:L-glutamate gamma-semialdehyde dehydrogenase [Fodinicola feengrottensis]|uniref:L-glutamate gamma-semialdehyde dehydrogenase n=1 Tax=Fodinicola feengrottensis TaxID=435914 RepID=UPI0013D17152|nr:L-glutamate gamma-semialdehyde dehydrogenase [Fodinicola feengrottensis]